MVNIFTSTHFTWASHQPRPLSLCDLRHPGGAGRCASAALGPARPGSLTPCYKAVSQQPGAMPLRPLLSAQELCALRKKDCRPQTLPLHTGRAPFLLPRPLGPEWRTLTSLHALQLSGSLVYRCPPPPNSKKDSGTE